MNIEFETYENKQNEKKFSCTRDSKVNDTLNECHNIFDCKENNEYVYGKIISNIIKIKKQKYTIPPLRVYYDDIDQFVNDVKTNTDYICDNDKLKNKIRQIIANKITHTNNEMKQKQKLINIDINVLRSDILQIVYNNKQDYAHEGGSQQ